MLVHFNLFVQLIVIQIRRVIIINHCFHDDVPNCSMTNHLYPESKPSPLQLVFSSISDACSLEVAHDLVTPNEPYQKHSIHFQFILVSPVSPV